MRHFENANRYLEMFKGSTYIHGIDVLGQTGSATSRLGNRAALVVDPFPGSETYREFLRKSLQEAKVEICVEIDGARPNAPRVDLERITEALRQSNSNVILAFGGGSTIDAVKAAEILRTLEGEIDNYFGTGRVSTALEEQAKQLTPIVAIQTAASSGAHLTKYSNITDLKTTQKKLIVDEAIIPAQPIFDYTVTLTAPKDLTIDGAMDGVAHCLEVVYGAVGYDNYAKIEKIALEGIGLVVDYLPVAIEDLSNIEGRYALGLATDLGGYAIMLGGTNGGHLTSFSLVDILNHGRACALMNPYYTVLFAEAIQKPLQGIGAILKEAGFIDDEYTRLDGRELALTVANGLIAFAESIGFPTHLDQVEGFTSEHLERTLAAAKDPQLKMKLENMPVPLTLEQVDPYMGSVLMAAKVGDLMQVRTLPKKD
jgi:alcohol dehydrogenase